jgi:glycosyltransferase involved in cell wall biosynthesis
MNSSDTTMSSQASFIDIPIAQNVQQILAFDDQSFVYCAYRTLLKRDPDDVGMTYYLGRLRGGENKMQVLKELHASAEGRRVGAGVAGLEAAIRRFKIARMFGISRAPAVKQQLQSQGVVIDAATTEVITAPTAPVLVATNAVRVIRVPSSESTSDHETAQGVNDAPARTVWVDLTTSMEWTEGVVGIIRAELEIACGLHRLHDNVRFSMQIENGFVEIQKDQLQWLLDSENVADAYMNFFKRYKSKKAESDGSEKATRNFVEVRVPETTAFYFPFKSNDVVISVGWMDSKKEVFFSKLKQECSSVYLCYLIYDIILLLKDTAHFYDESGRDRFKRYIKWISYNCDFVLFGGETAKTDTTKLQLDMGWPTPPGAAVMFGTDIMKSVDADSELTILKELGITRQFIMTVGSIEPRKNHDTLYRAYLLALQMASESLPQLVICGRPMWRVDDLIDTIDRDPRLAGRVIRISPTDTQLAALYKRCLFTLLPSMYEGWSLTLPESLGQGKFCLCADTPPLREIGQDLIDYAPIWDVRAWAEKIVSYSKNAKLLKQYETRLVKEWPQTRWLDTASMIFERISKFTDQQPAAKPRSEHWKKLLVWQKPVIWMDITLTYLQWSGGVTGIIRSELNFARYLKSIEPSTRYFAHQNGYFFEVLPDYLQWLFNDSDLATAYKMFQTYWEQHEAAKTGHRNPFQLTGGPSATHPAFLSEFPTNSIVLFVGIDSDGTGTLYRSKDVAKLVSHDRATLTSQLIYDFTPILYPQFHTKETCFGYVPFIKNVSETFDHLLFGGRTAQRDGILIQQKNKWKIPASDFIEFGSNFEKPAALPKEQQEIRDHEIMQTLGVASNFIMTVGTLEPRKNHEMLYKAYVTLLNSSGEKDLPQMLFIGKKGWKSNDFLANFEADSRIKGKIVLLSPTDEELDALYRHCRFTLLPSFYEGWSLTLPESLSYGKFCLTSDVDPLKETGRDLVEYINPLDTFAWADRIRYYATHPAELAAKEAYIKEQWKPKTWRESTVMLRDALYAAHKARYTEAAQATQVAQDVPVKPAGKKVVATVK